MIRKLLSKIIFVVIIFPMVLFVGVKGVFAQTTCTDNNACYCTGGADGCCDVEGYGGYNCGNGGGDGGTSCFPAGTKVAIVDGAIKNIEDVRVGDQVVSESATGVKSVSTVTGTVSPMRNSICTINYIDGDTLDVTSEHPLLTNVGWKSIDPKASYMEMTGLPLSTLGVGDKIVKIDGSYGQVSSIACRSENIQTYNLQLNNNGVNTYFANGYLAHNLKGRCVNPDPECRKNCVGPQYCPPPGGGTPSCSNTAAENLSPALTRIDEGTFGAIFTWNHGDGNDHQAIGATTNWDELYENDCRSGIGVNFPCAFNQRGLPANQEKFPLTGMVNLRADTAYISLVDGYTGDGECSEIGQNTFITSCNFPAISIIQGQIKPLELKLNADPTTVDRVTFSVPSGTTAITLPPTKYVETGSSGSTSYSINIQANSVTTSPITVTAVIRQWESHNTIDTCQTQVSVTPSAVDAWWQVKDSDLQSGGGISSIVPTGNYFGLVGDGGYPGIPVYSDPLNLGQATGVSTKGWIAQSLVSSTKLYDYQSLVNLIPDDIKTGYIYPVTSDSLIGAQVDANGYEWYKYTGPVDLNINSALNFGSRKVILLVENANLNINQNVDLTDNGGFFLAIVNGNIKIDPPVTSLKGLYVADSGISTGTGGTKTDSALTLRGSLAAYGVGLKLERQLANNSNPAEFFEFAPDQFIRFPSVLGVKKTTWKEVAP